MIDSQPTPVTRPPSWRRPLRRILSNWLERHRDPFNFWIHLIGIPLALAGFILLVFFPWWVGLAALGAGYLLQYLGHRVEGNDVGEWAAVKRLLGRPYVAIAPRRPQTDGRPTAAGPANGR